jgi:phosphopantothenoylcysteine decarboxylase/phosphopantothenate--cysteine ligase
MAMAEVLSGKTIILGVTGGVAAYKAAEVCSALVKSGAAVHVVMTENAMQFVGAATFRALTGRQVLTGMWDEPVEYEIAHVSLPEKADLLLIAPATANIIGKAASGIADDMLSTILTATTAPVLVAPAMNCKMWANPIVKSNVERLKSIGYTFIEPEEGRLACGSEGAGRLADPATIVDAVLARLRRSQDLEGVRILVTAGPTQEAIDPVRFVANRSSGKMGYAIARDAEERGAEVVLVSGPTALSAPDGIELVRVRTAAEMFDAVMEHLPQSDVVIGAAAPADYAPKSVEENKIKKSDFGLVIELEATKDIISEVGRRKDGRVLVAFAAETENVLGNAKKKLEKKRADLIVANDVSQPGIGFDSDSNEVTLISADGSSEALPKLPKSEVARKILDRVKEIRRK